MSEQAQAPQSARQLSARNHQENALRWVIPTGIFGVVLVILFYAGLYLRTGVWQMAGVMVAGGVSLGCLGYGYRLYRRREFDRSSYWVLSSMMSFMAVGELLSAGTTLYRLVFGSAILVLGGDLLLPGRWRIWGGLTIGFIGYIALVNVWQPFERFSSYTTGSINLAGLVLVALAIIAILLRVVFFALHAATLRNRLRIAFMVVALIPGLVIVGVSIYSGVQSAEQQVGEQLMAAAIYREELITRWVDELAVDIMIEARRDVTNTQRLLTPGTAATMRAAATRVQRQYFAESLTLRESFGVLLLLDASGQVVVATDPGAVGTTYFHIANLPRTEEAAVYVIEYSSSLRETAIGAAYPIFAADGRQLLGYMVGETPLYYLMEWMSLEAGMGQTGESYLVNASSYLLLTPLRSGVQIPTVTTEGVRLARQDRSYGLAQYLNYDREPVIGAYRWLPRLEVVLLAEAQLSEAYQAIIFTTLTNLGVMLGSVLLAWLAATMVTRSIADPMAQFAETALQIAQGDLTRVVDAERDDEIGTLARAFNQMTGQLRAVIDGLEARVAERTADLERRSAQLEASARVSRQAASIRDVDELLNVTVRQISEQFGFYHAGLFLVDEPRKYAVLRAASSAGGQAMLARGHRLQVGQVGIVGDVAATGRARIALDVGEDAHFFNNPDLPETHSEMGLPLQVRDEVIGVLDVQSTEREAFSQADVTYLQTMADQVALAIDNARLLAETERRLQEISHLLRAQSREGWQQMVQERPTWGYVYDGGKVRPQDPESLTAFNPQLEVPLHGRGEVIGALKVALPERVPSADEVDLATAIVEQAGQALESARLFSETQTALEEVGVLYRGSQAIGAAGSPDEVLMAFVNYLVAPAIDRCVLALIEPDSPEDALMVRVEAAWDRVAQESLAVGNRWNARQMPIIAQLRDQPLAITDVTTASQLDAVTRHTFTQILHIRAVLAVPLLAAGQLLGWLLVETQDQPYEFGEREIRLYRSLADQAAVVLRSLRLLDEATQRAAREQRIAEITAQVRASTDINTILRTSIRELGRVLAASVGEIRLDLGETPRLPQTGPLDAVETSAGGEVRG